MDRRSRILLFGALAVVVFAAAGFAVWRAVDDPSTRGDLDAPAAIGSDAVATADSADPAAGGAGEPGSTGGGAVAGSEPGAAGSGEPQPIEPGAGGDGAASEEPAQATGLDLRGTVVAVSVLPGADDIVGSLQVVGPKDGEALYDAASLTITKETKFFAQVDGSIAEVHPLLEDLKGRQVEAGFTGPVAESYPVQATAAWVTIL